MDEDEDDVFRKHWSSSHGQIKQAERGPQTGGPPVPRNGMLPWQMPEHRRLLYGNAGLLLLAPPASAQSLVLQENLQVMGPSAPRPVQSTETLIGQKLQLIGDQFYQEHMMHQRNQRVQQPFWWHAALTFLYMLLFGREGAGRGLRGERW